MDKFKIKNFETFNSGKNFPEITSLEKETREKLKMRISNKLNLKVPSDLQLLDELHKSKVLCKNINSNVKSFTLKTTLKDLGLSAKSIVYINWDRFENIDAIKLDLLSKHFTDIWYPEVDDIEIFDDTCDWFVFIDHAGYISKLQK